MTDILLIMIPHTCITIQLQCVLINAYGLHTSQNQACTLLWSPLKNGKIITSD